MRISTIILVAVITMAAATFNTNTRDCRHACRMDANGVVVQPSAMMMAARDT